MTRTQYAAFIALFGVYLYAVFMTEMALIHTVRQENFVSACCKEGVCDISGKCFQEYKDLYHITCGDKMTLRLDDILDTLCQGKRDRMTGSFQTLCKFEDVSSLMVKCQI